MGNVLNGKYLNSFSGTDITAVFGTEIIGTLQAISYSVTREKGPVYTMKGGPNPIAFARGKRAIAGTVIFVTLDQASLINHFTSGSNSTKGKFYANKSEIRHNYTGSNLFGLATVFDAPVEFSTNVGPGDERQETTAWYADQLLPYDVNISASNETGQAMKKSFIGVETMNEGGGISVDDLVIEEQYTYMCRDITNWTNVSRATRSGSNSKDGK